MAAAAGERYVWLPPALLFLAVLLLGSLAFAIANLHANRDAESLPEVPSIADDTGAAPFGPSGTEFQLIWQVFMASLFIAIFAGILYARWKGEKLGRALNAWEVLGYGFGMALVLAMVLFWPVIVSFFVGIFESSGTPSTPGGAGGSGVGAIPTSTAFPIALAAFAVIVIAVYVVALSTQVFPRLVDIARGGGTGREQRRAEASRAVRRTLLDLEAGEDFRTAVLACYQRMCSLLETRGVRRQEPLTPREIEGLALAELGLSQGSVDDLTGLFEEARYSVHEIGPFQRDRKSVV